MGGIVGEGKGHRVGDGYSAIGARPALPSCGPQEGFSRLPGTHPKKQKKIKIKTPKIKKYVFCLHKSPVRLVCWAGVRGGRLFPTVTGCYYFVSAGNQLRTGTLLLPNVLQKGKKKTVKIK